MSKTFEAVAISADFPASTVTFLVKQGIPLPIGLYRFERIEADDATVRARFAKEFAMNDADYKRREAAGEYD